MLALARTLETKNSRPAKPPLEIWLALLLYPPPEAAASAPATISKSSWVTLA